MTASAHQLELVPLPVSPDRGKPLVALRIEGDPVPWARPKPFTLPNGQVVERFVGTFAAWRTRAIREVARWWAPRPTLRVPMVADVRAVFERPHRPPTVTVDGQLLRYPWPWVDGRLVSVGVADVDNLAKGVLDVLQRVPKRIGLDDPELSPVLADDRLVVDLRCTRWYAADGEDPCMEVRLWHG